MKEINGRSGHESALAPVKKGQEIELLVTDLAFGGRGIAKVDGLTVFVDQAIPGDHVRARVFKKKKNYAEARTLDVITASPMRVTPPCQYSGFCGGCKWQFLSYDRQLHYKRAHVAESMAHIGQLKDIPVHPTIASPLQFGYRNKMEFSCSDRRWLLPSELGQPGKDFGLMAVGLHVPGAFQKVLDIETCHIQPDLGNRILSHVRQYIKESPLPVYGLKSHEGFWRFLMLRHAQAHDQWMVNIVTAAEEIPAVKPLAEALVRQYPQIVSVVNNITARKAGIAVGEYEVLLAGSAVIRDKIGSHSFEISANSFFQTNTLGAEKLYDTVKQYAGLTGSEHVLDLYCGTGTIGIHLSDDASSVMGIEMTESAIDDARRNCRINGIENCRFLLGDIKNVLPEIDRKPDVLIIDPPRVGMHPEVVKQVLSLAGERIVYVSCNPATLARDLGMMKDQYRVAEIQPVDMFPHTHHIEAVARLESL
ncbi:MAG: 23S rRNA (uracil(1939)-C(5))-methyltransferase RlmD [Deltaproteobacteria bacterium]|nr:23S rRNA (uracil(1939)-C(5))-methyltransferase RlmD [Deltaproteobacteria bacterium]